MRILIAMALLLLTPCALSYTVDDNFTQIVGGGQAASASYTLTAAIQQVVAGETASANYNAWLGWAYTIDSNSPFVYGFTPANGTATVTSQAVSFSIVDNWIGADQNNTIVYLNTVQSTAFNPRTDCTTTGTTTTCSYTETGLGAAGDFNITVRTIDYAGNHATGTTLFHYMGGQPTQPPTGGGGETPPPPTLDINYSFEYNKLLITLQQNGDPINADELQVLVVYQETTTTSEDTGLPMPTTKTVNYTDKVRRVAEGEYDVVIAIEDLVEGMTIVIDATIGSLKRSIDIDLNFTEAELIKPPIEFDKIFTPFTFGVVLVAIATFVGVFYSGKKLWRRSKRKELLQ